MVDVLGIVLGVLVVASFATIVAYVVLFVAVAAWTALTGSRRDPLADDLDRVLAEIVGPRVPVAYPAEPGGALRSEGPPEGEREGHHVPFVGRKLA